jgi:hypothetical protein
VNELFDWGERHWQSQDSCGDRSTGEAVVLSHTPEAYRQAYIQTVGQLLDGGLKEITSEEVRGIIGMPPNHPSAVGALMNVAAKYWGLRKIGSRRAVGRHQHLLTVWAPPGVSVTIKI